MTTFESTARPPLSDQPSSPDATTRFDVEIRPDRGRVIVIAGGELDMAGVDRLGAAIDGLVDVGFETVVLDLRRLTFMDSAGLCLIVAESRRPELDLRLIDGPEAVARVFDVCGVRDRLAFMDACELRLRG